jgi:hypothetical protein
MVCSEMEKIFLNHLALILMDLRSRGIVNLIYQFSLTVVLETSSIIGNQQSIHPTLAEDSA